MHKIILDIKNRQILSCVLRYSTTGEYNMEKKNIETFIKKYNLNGILEGVIWTANGNNDLSVTAMTSDKKLYTLFSMRKQLSLTEWKLLFWTPVNLKDC